MTVNVNGNSNDQEAPVNWRKDRVGRDRSICLFNTVEHTGSTNSGKAHLSNLKDKYIVTGVHGD